MSNLIMKNQELFVFFHGLRESILIADFYKNKKSKQTINQNIVKNKKNFIKCVTEIHLKNEFYKTYYYRTT